LAIFGKCAKKNPTRTPTTNKMIRKAHPTPQRRRNQPVRLFGGWRLIRFFFKPTLYNGRRESVAEVIPSLRAFHVFSFQG
jgi:hypothetical protein